MLTILLFSGSLTVMSQNEPKINFGADVTIIPFNLSGEAKVRLEIIDEMGNHVRLLIENKMTGGNHELICDNCSQEGTRVRAGVYFYKLSANKVQET